MKQVVRRSSDGLISIAEVPDPEVPPGWVLVHNRYSLISAGTERAKVEFAGKSLLGKARSRPDLVRKVVDKARTDGVRVAAAAARDRLTGVTPMGYASAGVVRKVGAGVHGLRPGDRVACGGAGWANHAEVVAVPRNLVAAVPDNVPLDDATYATVGAIALHAIRQAEVQVGDHVGVVGLGLIGQLAVRLLIVSGARVFGTDLDLRAVARARVAGALVLQRDDPVLGARVLAESDGVGLDAVLVCAATTSADPVELASDLARAAGRLVIVGDVPVHASREVLYAKELDIRVARSYGPGRYDRNYEERGVDLDPVHVRWTEGRNLQAFLSLLADGRLEVASLTTHRFSLEQAADGYGLLSGSDDPSERPFGIILEYGEDDLRPLRTALDARRPARHGAQRVGVIGAGSFARATLIPAFRDAGAVLVAVATSSGLSAGDAATRLGFERSAAVDEIVEDETVDAVVIATRHASHAELAARALRSGKSVFVEKPLALTDDELADVEDAWRGSGRQLMVGFNRRFARLVGRLAETFAGVPQPLVSIRVNAGPLPDDHWLHDPQEGGGRLLGEGCHFVDLLCHLCGGEPISATAVAAPQPTRPLECSDSFSAVIAFSNGAVGNLVYTGSGDARLPKERVEMFGGGLAAILDDYSVLEIWSGGRRKRHKAARDKGHRAEVAAFVDTVAGRREAVDAESYFVSTRTTLALAESLRRGQSVDLRSE